eukprot:scaffold2842_cov123-Skeletonema_marinoi.AAC.2
MRTPINVARNDCDILNSYIRRRFVSCSARTGRDSKTAQLFSTLVPSTRATRSASMMMPMNSVDHNK